MDVSDSGGKILKEGNVTRNGFGLHGEKNLPLIHGEVGGGGQSLG